MFGMEGNLDMIKEKVTSKVKSKIKSKAKVKAKIKANEVLERTILKVKNPVYLDFKYNLREAYNKYHKIKDLILNGGIVIVYSNNNMVYGLLKHNINFDHISYDQLYDYGKSSLTSLNKELYILTTLSNMPNRDDLSLIAENNDYLGNELFWDEHDEFKKDSFEKLTNFQFILENVDKVDVENNRIYVRRLKQVKSK